MEHILIIRSHVQEAHPLCETPVSAKKKEEQQNDEKSSENFQESSKID
jgi:hypothetical protein